MAKEIGVIRYNEHYTRKEEVMYKAINNLREQKGSVLSQPKGFTLIELLIVVAIIGILAAIAIPGYLGMQERGRKGAVTRASSAVEPELQAWLNSALKGVAGTQSGVKEVDSTGDGQITAADVDNSTLGSYLNNGNLDSAYVSGRTKLFSEMSPWDPSVSLFVDDSATTSRIAILQNTSAPPILRVVAQDALSNTLHDKTVYSD